MKAHELKHALDFVGDDADVNFLVDIDGHFVAVVPVEAQIKTEWVMPKRGELTPDPTPSRVNIYLEKP